MISSLTSNATLYFGDFISNLRMKIGVPSKDIAFEENARYAKEAISYTINAL
ncbi:MAG: hypothetical protein JSS09_08225 [Verrucomicrobia bacterium]|nr:hypothetical protein [Verrucomicrobiota bacterium]